MAIDREIVFNDVVRILSELREDWEHSDPITEKTGFFGDLGFESIDAVALGSSLEDHYNRSLPFAEFLNKAGARQAKDIYVGDLVDMLVENLHGQNV
jgi:acyl carrier protein